MLQEVYIEIGNACYAKCTTCEIPNQKSEQMTMDQYIRVISVLNKIGTKKVRLTGNEPLTNKLLGKFIEYAQSMSIEVDVLTTLLAPVTRIIDDYAKADKLRVSLSNVGDLYQDYFNVPHWDRFVRNLEYLNSITNKTIHTNCTLYKGNATEEAAINIIEFMNYMVTHGMKIHGAFFHSLHYGDHKPDYDQYAVTDMYNFLLEKHALFTYDTVAGLVTHKMSKCNVAGKKMYIKTNGDMYPCCMGGGELGQDTYDELKLGNAYDMFNTGDHSYNILLDNLNNPTCNQCTPKYYSLMPESWRQ